MIRSGVLDGFDWNVHPVYFAYAAVLGTLLWTIARLLLSVERLSGKAKPPKPVDQEPPEPPDQS